ncbi:unnamed protein product [Effrenium voratum]|nr:unnamed protein product [Effrenium voratum]
MKLEFSLLLVLLPVLAFKGGRRHAGNEPAGTLLEVSSDQYSNGRHKIGGQYHDDRMKELQKVKDALIGMMQDGQAPGGKNFNFYMSTVVNMVNVTMRTSLEEQFSADKAVMNASFRQFESCRSTLVSGLSWPNAILDGGDYGDQSYSGLSVSKKAHNDCREIQNQKKQLYDACVDDERIRWATVKAACDHNFGKLYNSVSAHSTGAWSKQCDTQLEVFTNTLPDPDPTGLVDLGDTDTEGYLIAQFNYWDRKLEEFLRAEALCKNATAKAEAEKLDCSGKLEAFTNASKECDLRQDGMDALACQQAVTRHSRCSDYDWCYGAAVNEWTVTKATMCGPWGKEGALDDELALLDQIECVLSALTSSDASTKAAECLNSAPKRDGEFKFPECSKVMPPKEAKQNCGSHLSPLEDPDMAGTTFYVDKYYTGPDSNPTGYPLPELSKDDPDHAPAVDVKACVAPCCTHSEAVNTTRGLPEVKNKSDILRAAGIADAECASPSRSADDGFIVYEGSLSMDSFNVRASCADNYKGHAVATVCKKRGEPYTISGCTTEVCRAPSTKEKEDYELVEQSLEMPFFSIHAKCKGTGTAEVQRCSKHDEPYVLSGCLPFTCKSPKASVGDGYQVFEGSKRMDGWDVKASCATGYEGTAVVKMCSEPLTPYSLSGCGPSKCGMPTTEQMRDYEVTVLDLHLPTFAVAVKCRGITTGSEPEAVPCMKAGDPFTLKNCKPMECLSPHSGDGYQVFETSRLMHNFHVTASCAAGYAGTAQVRTCVDPEAPYVISGCGAKKCVMPTDKALKYYEVAAQSLEIPSFAVSAQCQIGASGTAQVTPCDKDGEAFKVDGCTPHACQSPLAGADGYVVFEKSRLMEDFNVTAVCAKGYNKGKAIVTMCKEPGQPYLLTGCGAGSCTEPSAKAAFDYRYTAYSLEMPSFSVAVSCPSGKGKGMAKECPREDQPFTLEGCEPIPCKSPTSGPGTAGYMVFETSLNPYEFNVSAICADGYQGTPAVKVCSEGGKTYSLTGCKARSCSPPTMDVDPYVTTVHSLEIPSFSVTTKCKGVKDPSKPIMAVPCTRDLQPYTLEGCLPLMCSSPTKTAEDGYAVVETNKLIKGFNVKATCADGYMGTAKVAACNVSHTPYHLSGCRPQKCVEPPKEEMENYELTVHSMEKPSFSITAKCRSGVGAGEAVPCPGDGRAFHLKGCLPAACTSPRKTLDDGYMVYEDNLGFKDFSVTASCAAGYQGTALVEKCRKGGEPYQLSGCGGAQCTVPAKIPFQYNITTYSLELPSFSVSVRCRGHSDGSPQAVPCKKDGEPFSLEGCLPITCLSPRKDAEAGYTVFEGSKTTDHFDVNASCADGYQGVASVKMCTEVDTAYELSGCSAQRCVSPRDVETYSYELTEHSLELPSFSVTARCKTTATGAVKAIPCTQDGESYTLEGCLPGKCSSPMAGADDGYVVYEANKQFDRFDVKASCASGYEGTAVVQMCSEPETPYALSGCSTATCTEPLDAYKAYELTKHSLQRPSFSVSVKCRYSSGAGLATVCANAGEPFQLSGCPLGECTSPVKALDAGYVVYEASKNRETFNVTASCASGYKGVPSVTECTAHQSPYSLEGCAPEKCAEPTDAEKDPYDLNIFSTERPSFSITAACKYGSGSGKAKACTKDGEAYTLEGCHAGACESPRTDAQDGYVVYEASKFLDSFNVTASCANMYRGTAAVTKCSQNGEAYGLDGCDAETCMEPADVEPTTRSRHIRWSGPASACR